ncbi:MAG: Lrp/AsnC family transcriptional regulator [Candidatus Bathyarchaeota archaeon]|nr:Lrp/AsnC family transcriptional regulator [Candidatus Bathyarchaeota archaeon]
MDEVDQKIVEMLIQDARVSFRRIAKVIDKSPDTVINRFERLKASGDVRGSTVIVNPKLIGYEGMAAFHINISTNGGPKSDSTRILKTLIRMPNIIVATKTVGDHDLLAIGVIHDFDHLMNLGNEIAKIPGIKSIQTALWAADSEVCPRYFII